MAENSPRNLRDRILDHLPININSNDNDNVENQPLLGTGENNNNNDHVYWKKIKFYFVDLIFRFFKFLAITILLIIILFLVKNKLDSVSVYDNSDLEFDWKIDPSSYLHKMNQSFGDFNILLDGHSHTTYSDGKMTPDQLLRWSIGNNKKKKINKLFYFVFFFLKKKKYIYIY